MAQYRHPKLKLSLTISEFNYLCWICLENFKELNWILSQEVLEREHMNMDEWNLEEQNLQIERVRREINTKAEINAKK